MNYVYIGKKNGQQFDPAQVQTLSAQCRKMTTLSAEKIQIRNSLSFQPDFGEYTHRLILMHIAAMAYYINTLESQSSGVGMGGPNYFKVEDLF